MLGIHTVWTGSNRRGTTKIHDMVEFEVLTMVLSCLYWKRYQGKIKLYCDRPFYDYINELDLTDLWDEIDFTTLEQYLDDSINKDTFWAYCKMYVNSLQTEPFVSLDIDLFQDRKYDYTTHDIVYSHIELSSYHEKDLPPNQIFFYPNYHEWDMFKDRFKSFPNLKFNKRAFNVSVLAINDLSIMKDWMEIANSFAKNNNFIPYDVATHGSEKIRNTIHSSSLMTFIEQRLLSAIADSNRYSSKSMFSLEYHGDKQGWIGDMKDLNNPGITHLWGWKTALKKKERESEKNDLTQGLHKQLNNDFPLEYQSIISKISGKIKS